MGGLHGRHVVPWSLSITLLVVCGLLASSGCGAVTGGSPITAGQPVAAVPSMEQSVPAATTQAHPASPTEQPPPTVNSPSSMRTISGNAGTAGAKLTYEDGGLQAATADSSGVYSFTVPDGWSGTVTPTSRGFSFAPASTSYADLAEDKAGQDYTAMPDVFVYSSGAWQQYDFPTGAYTGGVWTGDPGGDCIPAPMDFNGDQKLDLTLLCGGEWQFYNDDGSYNRGIWTGLPSAVPVPADYDGDGVDEPVVFDGGAWQFFDLVTGAYLPENSLWTGLPGGGGTPAPLDFNGDGKADPSILSKDGWWEFYNDDGSMNKAIWTGGVMGDLPVPGDYAGTGTDQPVVFSGGAWQFFDFATAMYLPLSSVWTGLPAPDGGGAVGPAPMDYNGDGKLDFAYYAGGTWEFYAANGSVSQRIWTGGTGGDMAISRRLLP